MCMVLNTAQAGSTCGVEPLLVVNKQILPVMNPQACAAAIDSMVAAATKCGPITTVTETFISTHYIPLSTLDTCLTPSTVTATVTPTVTSTVTALPTPSDVCVFSPLKVLYGGGVLTSLGLNFMGCENRFFNSNRNLLVRDICLGVNSFAPQLFTGGLTNVMMECVPEKAVLNSVTAVGVTTALILRFRFCRVLYPNNGNPFNADKQKSCESMSDTIIGLAGNVFGNQMNAG